MRVLTSSHWYASEHNPVLSLLYNSMAKYDVQISPFSTGTLLNGSWDVWHLHWPENIVDRGNVRDILVPLWKFWIKLKLARFKGTKIFWTVHNLRPHEHIHPFLQWLFWRIFLPNVDGVICMSELGRQQLRVEYPRTRTIPTFVIPHGHYRGAYPDIIDKHEARNALDIDQDEFVIAFLGQIRAYKGVVSLIQSFAQAKVPATELLIAGKPIDDTMLAEVQQAATCKPGIRLFADFVDRNDIQKFLRAADLVILPYREILNSGSAILALSFDRPILVPALGALAELRELVGGGWVRLYEGELSPEIIRDAIDWAKARPLGPDARAPLDALDWDRIADLTIRAFSFNATLQQPR